MHFSRSAHQHAAGHTSAVSLRSGVPIERPPRRAVPYAAVLQRLAAEAPERAGTAQELIVAVLRRAILEGSLAADTRLRQRDLASVFGTSRIPVREALNVLEAEELLVSEPYRGFSITKLDTDALEEVYEMRAALEGLAVRIAVPLLTTDDLAELRRINDALPAVSDPSEHLAQCERFYFRLYAVTGRPRLVGSIRRLRQEVLRSFRWQIVQHNTEHHEAFFAAVLGGDAEGAAALLTAHYQKISSLLRRLVREPGAPAT